MLKIGDKVKIIKHQNEKNIGEQGEIIHIGSTIKGITQPVDVNLPKLETEPYYSVALDNNGELHNLKEKQLRPLSQLGIEILDIGYSDEAPDLDGLRTTLAGIRIIDKNKKRAFEVGSHLVKYVLKENESMLSKQQVDSLRGSPERLWRNYKHKVKDLGLSTKEAADEAIAEELEPLRDIIPKKVKIKDFWNRP